MAIPAIRIHAAIICLCAVVLVGGSWAGPFRTAQAAPSAGATVPWNGGDWFLLGANYPWLNYGNDFGSNAWGAYGVAANATTVTSQFTSMAEDGVHVARWWVFGDGRAGIVTDSNGVPTGINSYVYGDLDRALQIAEASGIYLDLVLFDFGLLDAKETLNGVQMGGRTSWIANSAHRTALIDNVVTPLLQRYGANDRIMMWEIMNEPEWAISDLPDPAVNAGIVPATMAQFWSFASKISAAVHANTGAYVTLGSACLKWNKVWTNAFADKKGLPRLNLDVYQTHYYAWMDPWSVNNDPDLGTTAFSPRVQKYADLGLDRPMIVGELDLDAAAVLDDIYANGYAGAWPWSFWGGDGFTIDWTVFSAWERKHAASVRIDGGAPTPTPTSTSTPISPAAGAYAVVSGRASSNSTGAAVLWDRRLDGAWLTRKRSTAPTSAWVYVNLGTSRPIGRIRWVFAKSGYADRMTVEVSANGSTWTRVASRGNRKVGSWGEVSLNVRAKYVRWSFQNPNNDKYLGGLAEIEVYPPISSGADIIESTPTPSSIPTATATSSPTPEPTNEATIEPTAEATPTPTASPEPDASTSPEPTVAAPTPEPADPTPTPEPSPADGTPVAV